MKNPNNMNRARTDAINNVIRILELEYTKVNSSINRNKYEMRSLVHNQTVMKRERKVIYDQIKSLKQSSVH